MEKSKTLSKKLISLVLSLLMVLSCFSGMSLTAYAAPEETLLTTITYENMIGTVYSVSNRATLETSGTLEVGGTVAPGKKGWLNSSPYAIGSVTVKPADGYTITKVVFWNYHFSPMGSEYNNPLTDTTSPYTCYAKSSQTSLNEDMSGTKGGNIAKIEVYGYAAPTPSAYAGYLPAEADDADALAAKVVKFNGYDWYLIEDNSTSETEGTVTLFAKDKIGSSRFDNSNNVYSGSMVKSYLDNLTAEGGAFADVADAIVSTDLEDVSVTGAKLWLLSQDEVITTYKLSTALNKCSNDWWLRTPVTSSYVIYVNGESGSVVNTGNFHMNTYGVRPALNLDLSKVEFDSETKTFALPAAVTEYPLWVGDVQVTSANMDDVLGDKDSGATVTFTPAATGENPTPATLTLKGATVTDYFAGVSVRYGINDTLVINLEGDNTIGSDSDDGLYTGLETRGSLIIQGNGKLAVKGRYNGIMSDGDITIESGEITASALNSGIQSGNENEITLNGGKVTAKGNTGIVGYDGVTIEGADVNAEGKNYAIFTADKDITISAGTVNATATGADTWQKALNGTVKNSIYGTGWTDSAGTEGKTAIATSTTGQDLSDYKKVIFISHIHDFSYSTGYNAIIAECTADGCTLDDGTEQHNHIISLNIVAPTLTTYGQTGEGISAEATLDGLDAFNAATGLNVSATDIKYYKSEESFPGYTRPGEELEGAPTDAGTYFAGITLSNVKISETDTSNVSAYVSYTIAKADPTADDFTFSEPDNLNYDGNNKTATVNPQVGVDGMGNATVKYYSDAARTNEVDYAKNAGTYYVGITVNEGDNYNATSAVLYNSSWKFTVAKANPTADDFTFSEPDNLNYDGNNKTATVIPQVSVNGMGNATVKYYSDAARTNEVDYAKNAGTYYVGITVNEGDNYNATSAVLYDSSWKFTVAKANIAPTVSLDGWTYGEKANAPSVTGNSGNGDVTYLYKEKGASDMSCTDEVPTQAGEYTVKALIAETANYNGANAEADFTIAKAKVTITADDKAIMREAALKELTFKVDGKILEGDDLGIIVTTNAKAAVAGKYDIKVTYAENANYDVTTVDGIYTVTDRITTNERTKGKNKINSAAKATVNKNGSITAKWGAVTNAEKFEVYAGYCDGDYKMIKSVKGDVHSFNITKLNKKALNQKKSVKIYVVAYRKVNGKYEKITQSVNMHIAGKANKHTNAKAIKVKKSSYTLKVNKTATIKPTLVLQNSKKKAIEHVAKFRYQSTNKAVATVDANGKITAVGKGTCWVYIFANNGKLKSVKVTVK